MNNKSFIYFTIGLLITLVLVCIVLYSMKKVTCISCFKSFESKWTRYYCDECKELKGKFDDQEYRINHKEQINNHYKIYRINNVDKIKNYYNKNREKLIEYQRSPEVRKKSNEKKKQDYYKNPNKFKSRMYVYYYINIPEGQLCERCKENKAVQRHHEDYSKPLEVKFLCNKCHNEVHSFLVNT